jgi:hypothetical protein
MNDTANALRVIDQMCRDGVVQSYAIGGAVAATFYVEPTSTYDIDVFVPFQEDTGLALSPIYGYLSVRGYKPEGAHVTIEGWQVQFLPADDALLKEALREANEAKVTEAGDIKTKVMSAEHLMAIALRTGRGKDLIRLEQFVQHKAFDEASLSRILERHNLLEKWARFNDKYIKTRL